MLAHCAIGVLYSNSLPQLTSFDKYRNPGVENFNQPIRHVLFYLQDRANPEVKLLPVHILILSIKQALPRNSASFIVSALASGPLKSGGRIAHGFVFGFLQAGVPVTGMQGRVSSTLVSERAAGLV